MFPSPVTGKVCLGHKGKTGQRDGKILWVSLWEYGWRACGMGVLFFGVIHILKINGIIPRGLMKICKFQAIGFQITNLEERGSILKNFAN